MFLRLPMPAKVLLIFIVSLRLFSVSANGQSNPAAQTLPYTQIFSTFDGSMSAYPPGFQGWNIPGTLSNTVITTTPASNKALFSGQTNASVSPFIGDMVGKIGMLSGSSSVEALCLAVNTSSVASGNVQLIYTIATQGQTAGGFIDEVDLQYRIGTSGSFTTITGAVYQNDALSNTNTAVTTAYNPTTLYVTLPAACTNHPNVQLRWIPRTVSGSGITHPSFSIANITVHAQTTTDYYCLSSGNLNSTTTWGANTDGTGTHPANFTAASQVFHIVNGNPGTLSANWAVTGTNSKIIVDQTNLTTPTGASKVITATVDVNVNKTLTISNIADTTSISLGTLDPASTVVFSGLTNMPVPANTVYGNVIFSNSTIEIPPVLDTLQFAGNFTLLGTSSFVGATASSAVGINLATYGNSNQLISANGLPLSVWNLDAGFSNLKSAGTVSLASNTTINAYNHFEGNLGGTALFADNGNVITIGNNLDLSGNASNYNLTGTIWMNGISSGSQFIRGGTGAPIAAAVNNIVFNSAYIPSKLGGGTFVINGNMVITDTAAFGLDFQGANVALGGNFINRNPMDLLTMASPATMIFDGAATQTYSSSALGGTTFYNMTLQDTAGLLLNSSVNVSGNLSLTKGLIYAGTDTLNVVTGGSVSGASTSSYVKGFMSKVFAAGTGSSRTFEIGDTTYSPVNLTFPGSITFPGPVVVKSTYGPHPAMGTSYVTTGNYVNRYWTVANAGVTVASGGLTASFSYNNGDMTGAASNTNYIIREYAGLAWSTVPAYSNSTSGVAPLLADVSKATGIVGASFSGDYIAGNKDCATSVGTAAGAPASLCSSGTATLSLTGTTTNTGNSYQWLSSPTGSGYTAIGGATNATYITPVISSTTYYICTEGCIPTSTTVNSTVAVLTVNPLPSAILGTTFTCAGSGQSLSDATGGGTWSSSNTGIVTIGSSGVYSGPLAGTATISYTLPTGCAATVAVNNIALPTPPSLSSLLMSFCPASTATLLTATADTVTGTATGTNSTTTFAEPKNSPGTSAITISSIPPGATITSVVVSFTIAGAGAFQRDNILNLSAPNGNKINLIDNTGSGTTGPFNNVTIGSAGTIPIVSGTNVVPGILYAANHVNNVPAAFSATYKSNTTAWPSLYSVPDGAWTFITDNTFNATEDTFKSWSISISYVVYPTITWSPVTGLYTNTSGGAYTTGVSTNNIYVLPAATTVYTVTTTSGSCSNSSSVEAIFGNPLYVPVVQGQPAICQGATTNLTDSLSGGVWTSGNAAVATVGSISGAVTGAGAGTTIITYSVTNGGCSGQATKVLSVTASPAAISGNLGVCIGAATALSDADAGAWSVSNANASIGTSGIVTGISAGLDTVMYASPVGCTTIGVVSVNAMPTLAGVSASSNMLCAGGSFALNAGIVSGTGTPISYNWSGPGGFAMTGAVSSTVVTPVTIAGSGIYSLSVSYAGAGCTTATSVTSPAVTVNAIPAIGGVTSSVSLLCAGATFTLTAGTASGTGVLSSYNWRGPAGYFTTGSGGSVAITPVTASASGVYSLSVTYPGAGCTSASAVTSPAVTVNALPTVAGINASTYTLCAGSSFTLAAGSVSGTGSLTSYNWSGPNGYNTTGTTGSATLSSATTSASGAYSVMVVYPGLGCTSTASVTSPAILVNAQPTVGSVTASANSLCIGGSFSLNAGSVAGIGSLASYNWSGPNGYTATGLTPGAVVTPTTTASSGIYSVSVTYPGTGCTSAVSVISPAVTVNVLPTVGGVTASVSALCAGGTFTLSAGSVTGIGSLSSYNWSGPGGYTATGAIANAVITPSTTAASGVYSLSVTYPGSGCTSLASVTSAVTVNTQPATISGTSSLCNLTTTLFNDITSGGAWSANNGNVTIDGSGNVTGVLLGASTISYIIGSCFATKTITVNAAPPAISGITVVCLGATTVLSDDQAGGSWATSAGNVSLDGSGNVTGTATGTAVITYSLGGSCSKNATVTVNDLPTISGITASASLLCAGGTFTLTAGTATGTGSLASYNWSGPGGYGATSVGTTIALTPSTTGSSGIYSLAVRYAGAGCISATSVITTAVTVNALPSSSGATNAGAVCEGSAADLFANSSNATAWVWSGPGGFSSALQNPTFTPTATATYSLSVSSIGVGCAPLTIYTTTVTVNSLPGTISGTDSVYIGSSVTLSDTASGGTWTADNSNVSVGSSTGIVSGVSAGTSDITYILGTGCTATFVVTVLAVPPAITGVVNLCPGSATTLSDLITGGTWSSSNGNVSVGSSSGIVNGVTAGTSIVTYTFPSAAIAVYATITVNPLPSAILGSAQVCQGLMTGLSDISSTGTWTASNGNATAGSTTGMITGIAPGSDTVTYTISATGCAISTIVTINPLPSPIAGSSQVCQRLSVALSDAGDGAWSSSNGNAAIGSDGIVTGISAGTSTITYELSTGCISTAMVTVNPLPNTITGPGNVCVSSIISLTDDGGGAWSSSNANVLISSAGSVTGVAAGTSQITYTLSTGCIITSIVTVNGVVVPSLSLSETTGDTVCAGTPVIFTATPVGGGIIPVYQWSVNSSVVAGATNSSYDYTPLNGDTVTASITSDAVCAMPAIVSGSITMTVLSIDTSSVNISATPGDTLCNGSFALFTALGTNGGVAPAYLWLVNGTEVGSGTTFGYFPNSSDDVYCKLVSNKRCIATDTVASNHIVMQVDSAYIPIVEIVATQGPGTGPFQSDTFRAIVTNAGPAVTYQWFVNTTAVSGATTSVFEASGFSNNDSVSCVATGTGSCGYASFNSVMVTIIYAGVQQVANAIENVRLIPNPNNGLFTIRGTMAGEKEGNVSLQITDMLGQVVFRKTIKSIGGNIDEPVSLGKTLANGMYMLNLRSGNENIVLHFVIAQ